MLPNYTQIADSLGVKRCRGISDWGATCPANHEEGEVNWGQIIHWRDRRVLREGVRRFLRLSAELMFPQQPGYPLWWREFQIQRAIPVLARRAHIRLPRSLGDQERAALKAQLINVSESRITAWGAMRDEALSWTRR